MKNGLTKIVLACGAALSVSACSSQQMMKAGDSVITGSHGDNGGVQDTQVSSVSKLSAIAVNKPFITEKAISVATDHSKGVDDAETIKAMLDAFTADLKKNQQDNDENYQKDLHDIKERYDSDLADINLTEYEDGKRSINIGELKVAAEINSVESKKAGVCPNSMGSGDGGNVEELISMKASSEPPAETEQKEDCDGMTDHLASLHDNLSQLKLEMKSIGAKEDLFRSQEQLRIKKSIIRARIAAGRKYRMTSSSLRIETDTKKTLVRQMHKVDGEFAPTINSYSDLADSYDAEIDKLLDYSDDDL